MGPPTFKRYPKRKLSNGWDGPILRLDCITTPYGLPLSPRADPLPGVLHRNKPARRRSVAHFADVHLYNKDDVERYATPELPASLQWDYLPPLRRSISPAEKRACAPGKRIDLESRDRVDQLQLKGNVPDQERSML